MENSSWEQLNIAKLLLSLGEDLTREGLKETPKRVESAWHELLGGYTLDPTEILGTTFAAEGKIPQLQMCRNIHLTSMCEHHLLPFVGRCHIGYIPDKRVAGLSKLSRLVDCFGQRLQIQERITEQIASALQEHLNPQGIIVVIQAIHMCCHGRGIRRERMDYTTTAIRGDVGSVDRLLVAQGAH